MNVLVTGGIGFIGSYIIKHLSETVEQIISYDRDFVGELSGNNVRYMQGELSDISRLCRIIREHKIKYIVHTAGMSHPELSKDVPIGTTIANTNGTANVLEAARIEGIKRVVLFSSECVYGDHPDPINEQSQFQALTPYAATKIFGEFLASVYTSLYKQDIVTLRIVEVYGPRNRMPQVIRDMILAGLRNQVYRLSAGGDHKCHFVFAEDVAKATQCALTSHSDHKIFNVTSGEVWSIKETAEVVRRVIPNFKTDIVGGELGDRIKQGPYSVTLMLEELGFTPDWTLLKGVEHYAEWLTSHAF